MVEDRRRRPRDDMVSDLLSAEITRDDGSTPQARPPRGHGVLHAARDRGQRDHRAAARLGVGAARPPPRPAGPARREPRTRSERGRGAAALRAAVTDPGALRDATRSSGTDRSCPRTRRSRCSPEAPAATNANTPSPTASTSRARFDRHVTFGYGVHFCLGANLARLEAAVVIEETLDRFPEWHVDEREVELVRTSTVRGPSHVPIRL